MTDMDPDSAVAQERRNLKAARDYGIAYANNDDKAIMELLSPDCDFCTFWGVVSGPSAIRVALAEEREMRITFSLLSKSAISTAWGQAKAISRLGGEEKKQTVPPFGQVTTAQYQREGTCYRNRGLHYWLWDSLLTVKVRETIILKEGRIVCRVLQNCPKTRSFDITK